MGKLVEPRVFYIGATEVDPAGLYDYLRATDNEDFWRSVEDARAQGLSWGEVLCSFYAKLCYKSLTLGQNANVTRVRDIPDNIVNCFAQGHGSVFEHASVNFVATDVSRVFTHELVRHRVGTAFSQTSGRYVRGDRVDIVFDPILEPVRTLFVSLQEELERHYEAMVRKLELDEEKDFARKKKLTSALRRILPNGQTNEIGFTLNFRSLRHLVQVRTAAAAEWEIRHVFGQVYRLTKAKFPLLYCDAKEREVDGLTEVYGMKLQPYEESNAR